MNDAPTADPVAPAVTRSPVLNEARVNLFRTLRLPVVAGVDDAVWKAEELLTLLRAGIPCGDPDPAPWLPAPGETEIRQAVQAAEEPLRRLLARLCWFDFEADPAGDLLRRAVATLAPADVDAFLNAPVPTDDSPPPPERESSERADADTADAPLEPARPGSGAYRGVIRGLNRANLLLLLAGRAISDAGSRDPSAGSAPHPKWSEKGGVRVAVNPHAADPTVARAAAQLGRAADLWKRALVLWVQLLAAPAFKHFVTACLVELNDDLIDPADILYAFRSDTSSHVWNL